MAPDIDGFAVILEDPSHHGKTSSSADYPGYRPRRWHTKSRNGCVSCKRRRIKCDEVQPECTYCWEKGIKCEYPSPKQGPNKNPLKDASPSTSDGAPIRFEDLRPEALAALEREGVPCQMIENPTYTRLDGLYLLEHFVDEKDLTWICAKKTQDIMQNEVLLLSLKSTYLFHAILGFSAAHLSFLNPDEKKWQIASALHYQRALGEYNAHLSTELDSEDADALFASAILLAALAFVHCPIAGTDKLPIESCTFGWVRSMYGTQVLLQIPVLRASLYEGIWLSSIRAFDEWDEHVVGAYLDMSPRAANELAQVRKLASICYDRSENPEFNVYTKPLEMLEELLWLKPSPDIMGRFVFFIFRLTPEFKELLKIKEPKSLLVIGFWLAFFSRIGQWWIVNTTEIECRRICKHIKTLQEDQFNDTVNYLESFFNDQTIG